MPDRHERNIESAPKASPLQNAIGDGGSESISRSLDREQMSRWAELIASGDELLPRDLTPTQLTALTDRVRRSRRKRLVQFIARAIALELHKKAGQAKAEL